ADRFLWFNSSSGQTVAPVSIVGGQMFINEALINRAFIRELIMGMRLQSQALDSQGRPLIDIDFVSGKLVVRSTGSNGSQEMTGDAIKTLDANGVVRVQTGNLDL
ncbi:TPA: hypothetical protein ONA71_006504, partial [Pseudomonas aeruginosa]|nr:hypothetical protein [Pseudomonas aeruginosa]